MVRTAHTGLRTGFSLTGKHGNNLGKERTAQGFHKRTSTWAGTSADRKGPERLPVAGG